jgi:hypothetical protein
MKANIYSAKLMENVLQNATGFSFNQQLSGNYLIICKQMITLWD